MRTAFFQAGENLIEFLSDNEFDIHPKVFGEQGDEVIFELTNPVSAGVMFSPETKKDEFLCLLMPLRLTE